MHNSKISIPIHELNMAVPKSNVRYSETIFSEGIKGLNIIHHAFTTAGNYPLAVKQDCCVFLIILKGCGLLRFDGDQHTLEKEALVVLPYGVQHPVIELAEGEELHLLQLTKVYTANDIVDLKSRAMPIDTYYSAKFQDCEAYTELIKSPNTVSRTVLPNGIIPRVALGTVEAKGPDRVGEHSHPMLEQLFLGLRNNDITVYADDSMCHMGEFTLLHIPLGSTHWVEVAESSTMHYMWMDFFLTKEGEIWLDTHQPIENNQRDYTASSQSK